MVMYLAIKDNINEELEAAPPAVRTIAVSTDREMNKHQITAQEFISEEAKESYYCQACSIVLDNWTRHIVTTK